ncbi:MAG: TrgA family protein, partial [Silicimonas sp.]|nr:TrgA family protein [Silicimonas sp.]
MPTGGKLIAAIVFAALAYFISDLVKPLLEDTQGSRVGSLSFVNAFIGLLMGWTIMG